MKTQHHHKSKTHPRPLFSCGFFRNCTQSSLSPTTPSSPSFPLSPSQPQPPSLPSTPPPPPPPPPRPPPPPPPLPPQRKSSVSLLHHPESSSSSSSSSASQSFTQWRFPTSPIHQNATLTSHSYPHSESTPRFNPPPPPPLPFPITNIQELFHMAELQLTTGSLTDQLAALQLLERSLVPNPPSNPTCPPDLMRGIVSNLRNKTGAKSATKVLLALCLAEGKRHVAVEAGAVGAVVEVVAELEGAAAERALAALELMCTVAEGAAELRAHALAVPVMVSVMGRLAGRGREYAISVISVIYSNGGSGGHGGDDGDGDADEDEKEEDAVTAPPQEVARAVVLALQGECTVRGRRKGAQLLKTLQEYGQLDLTQYGIERM